MWKSVRHRGPSSPSATAACLLDLGATPELPCGCCTPPPTPWDSMKRESSGLNDNALQLCDFHGIKFWHLLPQATGWKWPYAPEPRVLPMGLPVSSLGPFFH